MVKLIYWSWFVIALGLAATIYASRFATNEYTLALVLAVGGAVTALAGGFIMKTAQKKGWF